MSMQKVGDKYIIEIGDVFENEDLPFGNELYRAKGFNSLVFDKNGLSKLEKYDAENEYQRGLEDAWDCLKWIVRNREEAEKLFRMSTYDVLMDISPSEVIEKIKAYEEQKKVESEEIKVGDEIVCGSSHAVVTYADETQWNGFLIDDSNKTRNGQGFTCMDYDGWGKTGRTFPQIEEVLKQMQEGE